jgi:thioredoxin reductase (NADPH)
MQWADETDVAIIGAGPIGLALAVELQQQARSFVVLEAREIASSIRSYPAHTLLFTKPSELLIPKGKIPFAKSVFSRDEYVSYLESIAKSEDLPVRVKQRVISIKRNDSAFHLVAVDGIGQAAAHSLYTARSVVFASGSFAVPHRLEIPGEDRRNVFHIAPDPVGARGARVVIIGGRNSALEAAIQFCSSGARVLLAYRRSALDRRRAKSWLVDRVEGLVERRQLEVAYNVVPTEINDGSITLRHITGCEYLETADLVLILTGYRPETELAVATGIRCSNVGAPSYDPETMEATSVEGVFVAGTFAAGWQDDVSVYIKTCFPHVEKITNGLCRRLGWEPQKPA